MAPPITSVVLGEYGDIVAQKCGTCHKVLDLGAFSRDRNNKITGRQRRCKACFNRFYKDKTKSKLQAQKNRRREIEGVIVAPHVRDRLTEVARALGVTEGVYVATMVTLWIERDWDSEYERQKETDALEALNARTEQVPADDYITVEDRVSALMRGIKE